MTDDQQIREIINRIENLENSPNMPDHRHTGFDASMVRFGDIKGRKIWVTHNIVGTDAATASNYSTFFINQMGSCYVSGFWEVHATAGSDAGSVTIGLEKLTGTTAPGSGTDVLSSALSLKATANTVQEGTLTPTIANKALAIGDRLALEDTGTLTGVANVTVLVELTLSE